MTRRDYGRTARMRVVHAMKREVKLAPDQGRLQGTCEHCGEHHQLPDDRLECPACKEILCRGMTGCQCGWEGL